jgi:hypothetical protein
MISCEYVEPRKTPEDAAKFLEEVFYPLCREFWERKGRGYFGDDRLDIPLMGLIDLWMSGTLVIIAARDGRKSPVGFLVGGILRPLFCDAKLLKIEIWYGRDRETEEGLFGYLDGILKFLHVSRVYIPDFGSGRPALTGFDRELPQPGWTVAR